MLCVTNSSCNSFLLSTLFSAASVCFSSVLSCIPGGFPNKKWVLLCQVKKSLRGGVRLEAKRSTAEDKGLRGTGEMKQQGGQRQV